jgi:plasmid stabilization system protein ParE
MGAADHIAKSSPANAAKWYAGFERLTESLNQMPGRYGRARESESLNADLRQYIHYSHRVIFLIDEDASIVRTLHVRHAARRTIGENEGADQSL